MVTQVGKMPIPKNTEILETARATVKERLVSIDFMRGFTVASMILVNSPGSWDYVYPWLGHASWNGCNFADLVFPFFLFIVGLSIVFSLKSSKLSLEHHNSVIFKVLLRGVKLFGIGLLINFLATWDLVNLRIPGVLQRIAIVFVVCAMVYLKTNWRQQLIISCVVLIVYTLVLLLIPVPGATEVVLLPGKNIAAWVDGLVLEGHMWSITKLWDPEGVLSTFPAIISGLLGVLAGNLLSSETPVNFKLKWFITSSLGLVIVGYILKFVIPINKSLWTSTFVLFTTGVALFFLVLCYYVLDVKLKRNFTYPFIVFGKNAIAAYLMSEIFTIIVYQIQVAPDLTFKAWLFEQTALLNLGNFNASLLIAVSWVFLCYLPNWVLYKKRIFIKV